MAFDLQRVLSLHPAKQPTPHLVCTYSTLMEMDHLILLLV